MPPAPPHQQQPSQTPTCTNLRIRSVDDAHKIFFAVQSGLLPMVSRRLDLEERAALRTGCVYAWEERSPNAEITGIGIERFTEGRRWSASRVRDEFLFYYEKWVADPNSNNKKEPPGWEQLVKQTYSVWVETGKGRRKWHLTAYFTQSTVDQLGTVDDIPKVCHLQVPPGLFTSTRIGKRKNTEHDVPAQSVARVYAAFPSPLPPLAPRPVASTSAVPRPPSPLSSHPESPTTYQSGLHFSYSSPQHSDLTLPQSQYAAPTSTQTYNTGINGEFSTTRASGGWITSPLAPYQRSNSPRSEYNSSSSSSSSYGSSPAPSYGYGPMASSAHALPRLLLPVDPTPIAAIGDDERRAEIGPCRDLAPLNSLRPHPYRHRDPADDKTLRRLGPRATLARARYLASTMDPSSSSESN
ncbi:cAMP-independent regulatory protein pac2 [Mycena sanguinolenta]|uniref:cAMP-independent regulatory protein pac2 n=1 Tax=Mycena sanguinolenta TaxID=230812 RepID=A0A8H7DJJ5_9AGAR|nr:cAMP-independent regulatory protein pac2 [Mycena sanguinolenta]